MELYKDKKWLEEQYLGLLRNGPDIAAEVGVGKTTIYGQLHRHNIAVRSCGEARHIAVKNELLITKHLRDMLYGELLGDGNISQQSKWSAYYQHSSKHREYLVWLSGEFANQGLIQAGNITQDYNNCWHYSTLNYAALLKVKDLFYPSGGRKTIPCDLMLNSMIARQWFIGDGSLCHSQHGRSSIKLATCAFEPQHIIGLIKQLTSCGIIASYAKSNNSIHISTSSARDFLEWIGPSPIECYSYKWMLQDNTKQ